MRHVSFRMQRWISTPRAAEPRGKNSQRAEAPLGFGLGDAVRRARPARRGARGLAPARRRGAARRDHGAELAREVMCLWLGQPVLFMSGYTEDALIRRSARRRRSSPRQTLQHERTGQRRSQSARRPPKARTRARDQLARFPSLTQFVTGDATRSPVARLIITRIATGFFWRSCALCGACRTTQPELSRFKA